MPIEFHVVVAFTGPQHRGNPATVALLDSFPSDAHMQEMAHELGNSETAFVVGRSAGEYDLRWFTPTTEVDLCGHATLAAAHLLGGDCRFNTLSGVLTCRDVGDGWIELDLPADPVSAWTPPSSAGLDGVVWTGRGERDALFELRDAATVRELVPDLQSIASLNTRAVIVTAAGDRPGIDFVSRVFGPNAGIPEDPVTGSAHCTLAAYWSPRLGKPTMTAEQASARGGILRVSPRGDRVGIAGQAITTGHITLDY